MSIDWLKSRLRQAVNTLVEDGIKNLLVLTGVGVVTLIVYLLLPGNKSIEVRIIELEEDVPGYTYISQHLSEISDEMSGKSLKYEKAEVANLRVCKTLRTYNSRPEGEIFLDSLIEDLDGCIVKKRKYGTGGPDIELSIDRANSNVIQASRDAGSKQEKLLFCGCPQVTVDLVSGNRKYR